MTVVSVELLNENAMDLLKDLEKMNILKVKNAGIKSNITDWSKLKGSMTSQPIEEIESELKELRDSWA